jgi:hypothetical protein
MLCQLSVTAPGGRGSKLPRRECAGGRSDERKNEVGRVSNARLAEARRRLANDNVDGVAASGAGDSVKGYCRRRGKKKANSRVSNLRSCRHHWGLYQN